jgi:ribonuclease G
VISKELVIDVTTNEVSIALLEDKKLVELNKEKSNLQFSVGDVYLGRVKKVMPGLNAAFIDVGYEKDAFLHYLDLGPQFRSLQKYLNLANSKKTKTKVPPLHKFKCEKDIDKNGRITEVMTAGQYIMVQVAKEPISTKGPRLSSEISIAGRNLVLMPFYDKVSVSSKINTDEEKHRLKTLLQSIKPKNYGVIIRTVAEGKKVAELDAELRGLIKKWESAFENMRNITPPRLMISELSRTSAILRDMLNATFTSIIVNNESIYNEVKSYIATIAPEKQNIVKNYTGQTPVFERFGVEKQVKGLFGKTVSFKNGAYLIIEHTEALHVIDVNSGNRSKSGADQESNAVEVNSAAAEEIARQLRLRDMGGIIVVDFIDMQTNEHKQRVFERMKEAMQSDRTKHNILPLSKFGIMQITRQRVRPEMHIETTEKCPTCGGTGEITPSILFVDELENHFRYILEKNKHRFITLKVHHYVGAYLKKGLPSLRMKWLVKYKCWLKVEPISSYDFLEFHFIDTAGDEILT